MPSIIIFFIGNGVKYNKTIIYDYFSGGSFSFTPLDNATVHNIFLEIYSDYGIILLICVVIYLLFLYFKFKGLSFVNKTPFLLSIITFVINYNLEANYVHYYFWTMLGFYYYAYLDMKKLDNAHRVAHENSYC